MKTNQTLPELLIDRVTEEQDRVALRYKELGIWNEVTWGDYYKSTEQLAMTLFKDFNFKPYERIALIGENKPGWLYSQMATQVLGGSSVGIYQESLPEQLTYYLNDCQARIVMVEGQEQVDKLLEIEADIPLVEKIVYYNDSGMRHYDHPKLVRFAELLENGEKSLQSEENFFRNQSERVLDKEIAIIAYSAATTGEPRGSMLSHSNLISAAQSLVEIDTVEKQDDYYSFLPLAWIHEQIQSIAIPLLTGSAVNFPEKPNTVLSDLIEINPHVLLAPARVYQTMMSNFTTRIEGASWFKKKVYQFFKKYADEATEAKLNKTTTSIFHKFIEKIGDLLMFKPIRHHYGFSRIKQAYVAGSALESEAFYFYHSIGVNIKQTYGGTELSGVAFIHRDDDIQPASAGMPLPGTEVEIKNNGEIFVRNRAVFSNYLHEKDRDSVIDGWISLGDCGYLDDTGHLHILDRDEDIINLPNNKQVYPRIVENKLKGSPYIQEAICFGKNKPYVTAILNIDLTSVGRWADKNRVIYTAYSDLSQKPGVVQLIEEEMRRINASLPEEAKVRKFIILHKQFNPNDGELTRTLVVRRKFVSEKYNRLIESMYKNSQNIEYSEVEKVESELKEVNLQIIEVETEKGVA